MDPFCPDVNWPVRINYTLGWSVLSHGAKLEILTKS